MTIDMTEFAAAYKDIAAEMLGTDSIQIKMIASIKEAFDEFGLDNEQMGQVFSELAVQTAVAFNKDAIAAVTEVAKIDMDIDYKAAQTELVLRQKQGYDDNMLLKIVEHQASLASFAVNAGSNTAQSTVTLLKDKMVHVENRVIPLVPRVAPSNLIAENVTSNSLTLSWGEVFNAASYTIYRDGVQIGTSTLGAFNDTGLTASTEYEYTATATITGVEGQPSAPVLVTTGV